MYDYLKLLSPHKVTKTVYTEVYIDSSRQTAD